MAAPRPQPNLQVPNPHMPAAQHLFGMAPAPATGVQEQALPRCATAT